MDEATRKRLHDQLDAAIEAGAPLLEAWMQALTPPTDAERRARRAEEEAREAYLTRKADEIRAEFAAKEAGVRTALERGACICGEKHHDMGWADFDFFLYRSAHAWVGEGEAICQLHHAPSECLECAWAADDLDEVERLERKLMFEHLNRCLEECFADRRAAPAELAQDGAA
jgi:hypothetical protein